MATWSLIIFYVYIIVYIKLPTSFLMSVDYRSLFREFVLILAQEDKSEEDKVKVQEMMDVAGDIVLYSIERGMDNPSKYALLLEVLKSIVKSHIHCPSFPAGHNRCLYHTRLQIGSLIYKFVTDPNYFPFVIQNMSEVEFLQGELDEPARDGEFS